jgi:MATE family, multidrug efflux pump
VVTSRRRDPHDREILRLALPALGALTVEPLYVLVDTAIVGRLGTDGLGGLAVAGALLVAAFNLCNFLAYSTTAAVARHLGAGDRRAAAEQGVAGVWLAFGLGALLAIAGLALSSPLIEAMGASRSVAPPALTYLRISLLGAPAVLIALAGMGYLRGMQNTRTTFMVALAANGANVVLEVLFVYGFDLGIAGSAWGTVIAQYGAAVTYLALVGRAVRAEGAATRPRGPDVRAAAVVGGQLVVRTASLLLAFTAATAVAARIDDTAVAAHQVAFQIFLFLGLSLDAIAIAGQAMIGHRLGARRLDEARQAARRMIEWGAVAGLVLGALLLLTRPWLVSVFTDDRAVENLSAEILWFVAALQPGVAVVFVLDGVLIGAGDARYLAKAMMAATFLVFAPALALAAAFGDTLAWIWAGLSAFMAARLAGNLARFHGVGWQVGGPSGAGPRFATSRRTRFPS